VAAGDRAANRNYRPGTFTTSLHTIGRTNLAVTIWIASCCSAATPHRGRSLPLTRTSPRICGLFSSTIANRDDALAIPHHANLSDGLMFNGLDSAGRPIDRAYAARRAANEPLIEIANISQGETHPALSPEMSSRRSSCLDWSRYQPKGSYVRDALDAHGDCAADRRQSLPVGFVGGTDLSDGLSDAAEDAYLSQARSRFDTPAPINLSQPVSPSFILSCG